MEKKVEGGINDEKYSSRIAYSKKSQNKAVNQKIQGRIC